MLEMFSYEVPLGSIGQLKTGDTIEQGIIKEIHFVGLNESTMVVTGVCETANNTFGSE
jgi:hypothetical protein